jgi:RimJ/RimL family protein N-acetyltransferase
VTVILQAPASARRPALRLRPWDGRDAAALIDIYRDPVLRQWARSPITTEQDASRWLEAQQQGWADGERRSFAVTEARSASVLGHVVLKGYAASSESAEVGYLTAAAARNCGVASQAVELVTGWAFDRFGPGLRRIELLHQQGNLASCRVAQKSGYALTAVLPADPSAFPADGHVHTRYAPS